MEYKGRNRKVKRQRSSRPRNRYYVGMAKEVSRLYNMVGNPPRFLPSCGDEQVFHVIDTVNIANIVSSAAVPTFHSYAFTLSLLPDVASYGAVFDQYRIDRIECWGQPRADITVGPGINAGILTTCVDYDDANVFVSTNDPLSYQNRLVGNGTSVFKHDFQPHAAPGMYSGAVFTGFGNVASPWIDVASTTVEHYGIKLAWGSTDAVYSMDIFATFHLSFKNAR